MQQHRPTLILEAVSLMEKYLAAEGLEAQARQKENIRDADQA